MVMEIKDLPSYNLFQEINDSFQLFSEFIVKSESGLEIKSTFTITKMDEVLLLQDKTEEDLSTVLKWIDNERLEIIEKSKKCINLTEENYTKFKSENSHIKAEVKDRVRDLKKIVKFFGNFIFDPLTYDCFSKLKAGPDINSDYAGITVTETKYYLI